MALSCQLSTRCGATEWHKAYALVSLSDRVRHIAVYFGRPYCEQKAFTILQRSSEVCLRVKAIAAIDFCDLPLHKPKFSQN